MERKGQKMVGPHHPALGGSLSAMARQPHLLERLQWLQECSFAFPYFPREYLDSFLLETPYLLLTFEMQVSKCISTGMLVKYG